MCISYYMCSNRCSTILSFILLRISNVYHVWDQLWSCWQHHCVNFHCFVAFCLPTWKAILKDFSSVHLSRNCGTLLNEAFPCRNTEASPVALQTAAQFCFLSWWMFALLSVLLCSPLWCSWIVCLCSVLSDYLRYARGRHDQYFIPAMRVTPWKVTSPKLGLSLWLCSVAAASWPLLCPQRQDSQTSLMSNVRKCLCPYEEGWSACALNGFIGWIRDFTNPWGMLVQSPCDCCWTLAKKIKDFWVGNIILSKGVTYRKVSIPNLSVK